MTILTSHSDSVYSLTISSDGQILASGSDDSTIKLWSIVTGEQIHTLSHFYAVLSVAFNSDRNWLAAGDYSGNIKIWRRS
ncbi:WD40 repeat domain-containing protein [Nostoc sp. MS1]|uniref:WD40 repeat domain-containing protein n=1 Tax=Nostoc sp. MS1 TaxID=2764711 RepID=UPI001CC70E3A|nr:hypothetical protein [Nostoc sp. MS1]